MWYRRPYLIALHDVHGLQGRMTLADDVDLEVFIMAKDELSGADIKAICTESGLLALRERRMKVRTAGLPAYLPPCLPACLPTCQSTAVPSILSSCRYCCWGHA